MFTRSRIFPLTKALSLGALLIAQLVAPVSAAAQFRVPQFGVAASVALPAGGAYDNGFKVGWQGICLLYTSPSPRDLSTSRMPSSA